MDTKNTVSFPQPFGVEAHRTIEHQVSHVPSLPEIAPNPELARLQARTSFGGPIPPLKQWSHLGNLWAYQSGWWFGTCFFSYIGNSNPN